MMLMFPVAMVRQAEVVQLDRWDHGPMELVFLDEAVRPPGRELDGLVIEWNMGARGGFVRPEDDLEAVQALVPALRRPRPNPNVYLVPRVAWYTELHAMLASVVPGEVLARHGIRKFNANFWLVPNLNEFTEEGSRAFMTEGRQARQAGGATAYARAANLAFTEFIWTKLAKDSRWRWDSFAADSSIRMLADDTGYWMARLYRYAVESADEFEEAGDDPEWARLDELTRELHQSVALEDRHNFVVRRPRKGGRLWDVGDPEDCEAVVDEMLDGGGVMDALDPVLEVLRTHRAPEDFSDRYSWVKEDFERSFYRKRAKLKVSLVETVDELPVWSAREPDGHGDLLFRDLLAFFDQRDRHLLIALRHGKTVSEIARELGHKGHAAVSRRVQAVKDRLRGLLG